jgi:hypothetical protein
MPGIGRDLLDLPFAELVRNLAVAIADGQAALDRNSLETLKTLVDERVDLITDITEVIEPQTHPVDIGGGQTITVTGARIRPSAAPTVPMSMFQAGLTPTFYQFTEAAIEVRLSITMREDTDTTSAGRTAESGGFGLAFFGMGISKAYASSVDYRTAAKYQYAASGASVLRATLRPVPPPARLEPAVTTINTFSSPPLVTRTGG